MTLVRLGSLARPELIFPDLEADDAEQLLRALAEKVAAAGGVKSAEELCQKLREREKLGSTAVGSGVAIPHCKMPGLRDGVVALGVARAGVDFGAADGVPVRVFFLVVSPSEAPAEHLQTLAALSRWIKTEQNPAKILASRGRQEIYELLQRGD